MYRFLGKSKNIKSYKGQKQHCGGVDKCNWVEWRALPHTLRVCSQQLLTVMARGFE